jgi:hypothetical protein
MTRLAGHTAAAWSRVSLRPLGSPLNVRPSGDWNRNLEEVRHGLRGSPRPAGPHAARLFRL